MKIKFLLLLGLLLNSFITNAQNKHVLFGFNDIPQTLMLNPGAEVNFRFHTGIPLISGIYVNAGVSGFNASDLFSDDGIDINDKFRDLVNSTDRNDYYTLNQQLEIFNIGFRKNQKDYISFGFYQETDIILYHPKDFITLAFEGNQNLGRKFSFSDLTFKAEVLGVFHLGINRKLTKKLTVGARAKIYSSAYNAISTNNSGSFVNTLGTNNIYNLQLQNVDFELSTSGITTPDDDFVGDQNIVSRFFLSGNMGLGVDLGLTFTPNKKFKYQASLQDFGFIRHTKNVTRYQIKGEYDFEGLNFQFPTTIVDYWQNLEDDFNAELPFNKIDKSYTSYRSIKLNASATYTFGKATMELDNCIRSEVPISQNEVGLQVYSIFRPERPQVAVTAFYYRKLAKFLSTKVTYTVDHYSATNLGLGLSTHIGAFNFYATADNLFGYTNLSKSKNQSFQFGMNVIFNN
jgi:hypothetical protein